MDGTKHGHVAIIARDFAFWLRLQEEGVRTRGPWEAEVERYRNVRRGSWPYGGRELPSGAYDAGATGRLKLELFAGSYWLTRGRQSRWADRRTWTLEDRLPHRFREIEERVADGLRSAEEKRVADEQAIEAAGRAAEDREREWRRLMDHARERLVIVNRIDHLRVHVDAWHEADRLRAYCDAAEIRRGDGVATAAWLAWAREHADKLDPLREPPVMPAAPEPTTEALQEHLPDGWSAEGPERGRHATRRWTAMP